MRKKTLRWHEMDKSDVSLKSLLEEYLVACKLEGKSPKTIRGYREKLSRFVQAVDGTLADFNLAAVRAYVARLQETRRFETHPCTPVSDKLLSPMTVRNHIRVLTAFASWLQREDYQKDNVLAKLRVPKAPRKLMQTLNSEEVARILGCLNINTASGCRDAAMVSLFLDTGLRLAELLDLSLSELHLENEWLKVMGKGQKERIVPFGAKVTRLLQRYIIHFRPKLGGADKVFLSLEGEPLTETAIASLFRRLAKRANVPRLHVHLFRHTFATNYLIGGGDSLTLQRILGHETLEMTRRYVDYVASQVVVTRKRISPLDTLTTSPGKKNTTFQLWKGMP